MILAHYIVHYGSDYIGYSIKSVYNQVDKIFVNYTGSPSHGHSTNLKNPDSKEMVLDAIKSADPQNKVDLFEGKYSFEGQHRNTVFEKYPNADVIVTVDADEIWDESTLQKCIEFVRNSNHKRYVMWFIHFWRSLGYYVTDEMVPVRFHKPKATIDDFAYVPREYGTVYHFGYAREPKHIKYKLDIHGHKGEWRKEWYDEIFMKWPEDREMKNLHPTNAAPWVAMPYDKTKLPPVMRSHPYYNMDVIYDT